MCKKAGADLVRTITSYVLTAGGVRHDPQRVLGKNVKIAHLPLVTIE